jgi:hypothetical protein
VIDPTREHPVQLVVADDLRRSRVTVFFRLLLALPHFFWIGLFGQAAFVVAFLNWWATLFRGRSPESFHKFLAGYVRYVLHVNGYVFLTAQPWPAFYMGDKLPPYPIDAEIAPLAPQNRLKTLFRLFLALPAFLLLSALAFQSGARGSGGIFAAGSFFSWIASLVRGRTPRGLRDLAAWVLGYAAQTASYLFLLTDRYPYAGPELHLHSLEPPPRDGRAQAVVGGDLRRSRLLVFFRLAFSAPHIVWAVLWTILSWPVGFVNWLATLVLGRSPRALARFLSAYVRYMTHFTAFFTLVGDVFPGFVGRAGSYPVDLDLDPFARQQRVVTLFRLVLALPALVLASAAAGMVFTTTLLTWLVALVRGRAPQGLRNASAYALGYLAQVSTYLLVVGDRYPIASPIGTWRAV